jgi:hypothetical protein
MQAPRTRHGGRVLWCLNSSASRTVSRHPSPGHNPPRPKLILKPPSDTLTPHPTLSHRSPYHHHTRPNLITSHPSDHQSILLPPYRVDRHNPHQSSPALNIYQPLPRSSSRTPRPTPPAPPQFHSHMTDPYRIAHASTCTLTMVSTRPGAVPLSPNQCS